MKFSELAAQVERLKGACAKRTIAVSRANFRRLVAYFGEMELREITEFTWNAYVLKCKSETPWRRLSHDRKHMNTVMLFAFREGHIPRQVQLKIPDLPREIGRELAQGELAGLLRHARPELAFQIEIAFRMGMRLREMLGLRWDRFDWQAQSIKLRPEDTKTRRGREVPIPSVLFPEFRRRHRKRRSPCVFPSRFDPSKSQYENKSAWKRCRRKAKVRARWHDLRHTCASIMLRLGVAPGVVSKYLGMSEEVLNRIYRHVNIEQLRAAADAMSKF